MWELLHVTSNTRVVTSSRITRLYWCHAYEIGTYSWCTTTFRPRVWDWHLQLMYNVSTTRMRLAPTADVQRLDHSLHALLCQPWTYSQSINRASVSSYMERQATFTRCSTAMRITLIIQLQSRTKLAWSQINGYSFDESDHPLTDTREPLSCHSFAQ